MIKNLRNRRIIIFLIILIISLCNYFKGLTVSTIEGIVYLETKGENLYSAQYESIEKQSKYGFITKKSVDDSPVIDYMKDEGYELKDKTGAIFLFSNGQKNEVISRRSIFNKYYIWEN